MWIINSPCRDRSTLDRRVLDFYFHIAGNNGDGIFTSLEPNKWDAETIEDNRIYLEFECINEIKNIIHNLQEIVNKVENVRSL